jgi:hypothetical protein
VYSHYMMLCFTGGKPVKNTFNIKGEEARMEVHTAQENASVALVQSISKSCSNWSIDIQRAGGCDHILVSFI